VSFCVDENKKKLSSPGIEPETSRLKTDELDDAPQGPINK